MSNITRKITRNQLKNLYIQQCKEIVQQCKEIERLKSGIEEIIDYIYKNGFYYDSDEGIVPNQLGMYEVAHITGELKSLIRKGSDKE